MSDEKENEEIIEHWSHKHPLSLVETHIGNYCYGCEQRFSSGEKAYGCRIKGKGCGYDKLLHEECAEMARMIRHPIAHHPEHVLSLRHEPDLGRCGICSLLIWSIGYKCTSSRCWFQMHMRCAHVEGGVKDATAGEDEQRNSISHPSHPEHELKLLRRKCSFNCDACGTSKGRGSSYTCHSCQYWIHEKCASLPQTIEREDHHHSLSISFHVPLEYIKYHYKCDVCSKHLLPKYWIYHCQLCSFIVHLKCAFNKSSRTLSIIDDAKDSIHLPANDVAEELIAPFVKKQEGGEGGAIPHDGVMMNVKYKFPHHQHELISISSSHRHQNKEEEEDDEDDDGKRSQVLICDGCITPIFSSSSSYMSCSSEDCKYNLHMACFHLPIDLPSHPFHHEEDHNLILQSSDELKPWELKYCGLCYHRTNGLFYGCTKCSFRVDIKCASLTDTIYHAAHPQHLLKYVTADDIQKDTYKRRLLSCAAGCDDGIARYDCYTCHTCSSDFIVHVRCALLPASVTSRKWDKKHTLPLTYDANLNHPGDFYCDECETEMNPKSWMYHCRPCDLSFHPKCLRVMSGDYKNIKFGQQYVIANAHNHTLTFQLLTTKRRCDICRVDEYGSRGFHCASCNFFICLDRCGRRRFTEKVIRYYDISRPLMAAL